MTLEGFSHFSLKTLEEKKIQENFSNLSGHESGLLI